MAQTLNLKKQMKAGLSKDILNALELCSKTADDYGFKIYLIGGVVRDLILGNKVFDIDITVQGNAVEFCHKLADKKYCKILQVQNELKTVKALFKNHITIDFASTRQEFYPRRGHLPVVVRIGCSLEEDVYRRDFTVNSLAMSLNENNFADVIDYVGGVDDLKNKTLRVLHDNSFNEDPSRIIRGLKFAARFDLHRDPHTKELQEKYINTQMHDDISWTRIKSELKSSFCLNKARLYDMFVVNKNYKLIHGEKPDIKGLEIKSLIDKYNPTFDWLVYLGTVLNDENIIEAFCFNRNEKKVFTDKKWLLENNLSVMNTNYDIYQFFHKKSLEAILIYYLLTKRKEPLIYLEKLIKIRVELNGEDLKELGIQDGKKIGAMLDEILKKKLAGTLKNKADEINFVKSQRK